MASMALDGDVRKTLLDRTDAEKVFRPWWDTIEDMLLNTLIGLGFLTLPTAYVTGNPVECVLHPSLWNESELFDMSSGTVGKISSRMLEPDREDQYDEENYGYSVDS